MLIFHAPFLTSTRETIQNSTYSGSSSSHRIINRSQLDNLVFDRAYASSGNADNATYTTNLGETSKLTIAFWLCPVTPISTTWQDVIRLFTRANDNSETEFRLERSEHENNYKWFNNGHSSGDGGIGYEFIHPQNEWRHHTLSVDISEGNGYFEQWIYDPVTKQTQYFEGRTGGSKPCHFLNTVMLCHEEATTGLGNVISDLRIYNHRLSQFEVRKLHKRLLLHYSFENDPNIIYQRLEYIETTGTQFINTQVYPTNKTRVVADWQYTNLEYQSRIFGCRNNPTFELYISGSGMNSIAWQDGDGQWASSGSTADMHRRLYDLDGANRIYKIGYDAHASYSLSSYTFTQKSNNWLALFGTNINGTIGNSTENYVPSRGKLYGCKIYEDGILIRDFIPVMRRNDWQAGLYDKVNDKFYENIGSGTFVKGPTVLEKI